MLQGGKSGIQGIANICQNLWANPEKTLFPRFTFIHPGVQGVEIAARREKDEGGGIRIRGILPSRYAGRGPVVKVGGGGEIDHPA